MLNLSQRSSRRQPVILTIGHSNRTLEAFLRLLRAYGVRRVLDFRTIPRSRHNPQFNGDTLPPGAEARSNRLYPCDAPGRASACDEGVIQYRMTQRLVPRVRRLYADGGL